MARRSPVVRNARRALPAPEDLGRDTSRRLPISFRLTDADHDALLALAERAGVGHSTLARRVVEHYIREHSARRRRS